MKSTSKLKKKTPLEIGDRVIERVPTGKRKRIGEIIFVIEGNRRKFELIQLNPHDLTPLHRHNNEQLKFFKLREDQCKRVNEFKYREKKTFCIGDVIRHVGHGRLRFGKIVSFVHPEGLYTTSNEKGYNGKDLIECVEIDPRKGLAVKRDADGEVKRFVVGPHRCKICEVLPMDKNGGVRIKNYWEMQKEPTPTESSPPLSSQR
jgi:hypothetical protein